MYQYRNICDKLLSADIRLLIVLLHFSVLCIIKIIHKATVYRPPKKVNPSILCNVEIYILKKCFLLHLLLTYITSCEFSYHVATENLQEKSD